MTRRASPPPTLLRPLARHTLALAAVAILLSSGGCTVVAATGAVVGATTAVVGTAVGATVAVGSAAGSAIAGAISSDDAPKKDASTGATAPQSNSGQSPPGADRPPY